MHTPPEHGAIPLPLLLLLLTSCCCCCCCAATDPSFPLRDAPMAGAWTRYLDSSGGSQSQWQLRLPTNRTVPATVPGDVVSDLLANPFHELNWLTQSDLWSTSSGPIVYSTTFTSPAPAAHERVFLVFDGVKMGAHASLNGQPLTTTALPMTDQFLRYRFDVTDLLSATSPNTLEVAFDLSIDTQGRFMACSGGWDWAPYTNTTTPDGHTQTFTFGIWKSVYLLGVAPVAIEHVVPLVRYTGPHLSSAAAEHSLDFEVEVRVHLFAPTAQPALAETLHVEGAWGASATLNISSLPAGCSNVSVTLAARGSDIRLWWPAAANTPLTLTQPLYNVTVRAFGLEQARRVAFRTVALVTGNDTDPAYVARAASQQGTDDFGMLLRINGGAVLARGANFVPMEELDGWLSATAITALLHSAREANFNTLRVWGGGVYMPDLFYDLCDELGLMIYHDIQYAQSGHAPSQTAVQEAELRHQARRLAAHPSVVLVDGCNECVVVMSQPTAIYATFVLRVVAEEDGSRPLWPSSPARGWKAGVHKLNSLPMPGGAALATPDTQDKRCTEIVGAHCVEVHRPKWLGSGWPAVNGAPSLAPSHTNVPWPWNFQGTFPSAIPLNLTLRSLVGGPGQRNNFSSESPGATGFSSFESMSPLLPQEHWGIHGAAAPDSCRGKTCTGGNLMAQRNYPQDNFIVVYFYSGTPSPPALAALNASGEAAFKRQLYQSMIGQALTIKQNIELSRASNRFGIIVWQLNEIWPTGGWGSLEYGNPGKIEGQVWGGRWKPLHHLYRASLYADVMCACDVVLGECYVRNDGRNAFAGHLVIASVRLADASVQVLHNASLALAAGAGTLEWLAVPGLGSLPRKEVVLRATVWADADGAVVSENVMPLATPGEMALQKANVRIGGISRSNNGTYALHLECDAVAVYVVATTLAQGRFADNAFLLLPPGRQLAFLPWNGGSDADYATFQASARVEDVSGYREDWEW